MDVRSEHTHYGVNVILYGDFDKVGEIEMMLLDWETKKLKEDRKHKKGEE